MVELAEYSVKDLIDITQVMPEIKNAGNFFNRKVRRVVRVIRKNDYSASMRVYLDNCVFNRPFDDQSSDRIKSETEAAIKILEWVKVASLKLIWSSTIEHENDESPISERRKSVAQWKAFAMVEVFATEKVRELSEKLVGLAFGPLDAIHVASAIVGSADYFVTTDDGILKRASHAPELKILNPIELLEIIENNNEH